MSGGEYGCSWMFFKKIFNSLIDFFFDYDIVFKKALMDPAVFAVVFDFLKVKVLNPVSEVGWSSERNYDFIFHFLIAYISWGNS